MRIVSLAPSNTEIVFELGAEDLLVGTTSLCDHPEEAVELPSVGGWTNLDTERVVELEPDLALASDDLQDELVEELRSKGVKVKQFKPYSLEDVLDSITEIGELLGKKQEAWKIRRRVERRLTDIDLRGKRIYCEEWHDPPMISGNWIPGLIKKCHGEYLLDDQERSRKVRYSEIAKFDPEVIILNICGAGENLNTEKIFERSKWHELTAVKNKDVYIVHDSLLNRPGPRLAEGATEIENKILQREK